jgi:hypothetical protein
MAYQPIAPAAPNRYVHHKPHRKARRS